MKKNQSYTIQRKFFKYAFWISLVLVVLINFLGVIPGYYGFIVVVGLVVVFIYFIFPICPYCKRGRVVASGKYHVCNRCKRRISDAKLLEPYYGKR